MKLSYDAEKFISLVKPREVIWNYRRPVYSDKEQRRLGWMAVCKDMVANFDEKPPDAQHAIVIAFQKQWKVLRGGFLRSLKNTKKKGSIAKPYTYFKDLKFMTELYNDDIDKNTKKHDGDSTDATSESESLSTLSVIPMVKMKRRPRRKRKIYEVGKEIIEPTSPTPVPIPAPIPIPDETLMDKISCYIENEERAKQNNDIDEDKLFLLSLLSDFKSIPEMHKLDAKFDILNVFRHYRNIGDSSNASSSNQFRNVTVASTTANQSPEICYVKCEGNEELGRRITR